MKNINAMEVICMKSKNQTKKGYGYYIDKMSIYTDENGDAYGCCYNGKGEKAGNVNLNRFHTTILNLIITIKED